MALAHGARPTTRARNLTLAVLPVWFLLALGGSLMGAFDNEPHPPVPLGLGAVVPVALFVACYLSSDGFRRFVLSLDVRILTLAQTSRVVGVVFLVLHQRGALPGVFALPAGWGDFAIGITAPVMAWLWKPPFPSRSFVAWSVLGCLDLVLAVILGALSSATPVGVLAGDVSPRLMGQFPLSLIPTFFVPLLLIFHLISLARVRRGMP